MTFALGKNRHEHIRAGHFFAAGGLDMNDRTLDDALEARCRLGIVTVMRDQRQQFLIDIMGQIALQQGNIDPGMFDALARLYEAGVSAGRGAEDSLCVAELRAEI